MCRLLAVRSLWKSSRFAIPGLISLGAGLGLTAALASVADAILLRPLSAADPEKIARVFTASAAQRFGPSSYPDFDDLRRASSTCAIIAHSRVLVAVSTNPESPAQTRVGLAVTPDYFDVLRVPPELGRTFRPQDSRDAVVILAHDFFAAHFASDPRVVGRGILLSGTPFTVIGVAPDGFALDRFAREDFYVPIGVYDAGLLPSSGKPMEERSRRYLDLYARLRLGATIGQARAELALIGERIASAHAETNRGHRIIAVTELDARMHSDRIMPLLAALLAGAGAVIFALACANVTGLLLVRAESRATEAAVQAALGATPARLFADNLAAGATLAAAGTALSIPVAWLALRLLEHSAIPPSDMRFTIDARIDARILLITACAAAIAAMVCGAGPSLAESGRNLSLALKSRTCRGRGRWRNALVTVEVALACALVACGLALVGAISAVSLRDPGFRAEHVLTLALDPAQTRYGESRARAFYREVLARVRAIPGVRGAALAQSVLLGYTGTQRQIEIAGEREPSTLWMNIITPEYFELLHMRVLRGRAFDTSDTASSAPVAIVNEELAKRAGIGARFRMNGRMVEVVGVVRTAKYFLLGEPPRPYFYLPFSQNYASRMILHVETEGDPAAPAHSIADAIHAIDRAQPVSEVRTAIDYLTKGATLQARTALEAVGAVAICGMILALAGLYGAASQWALARRKEIGIRIALGASRTSVLWMMLARTARLAAIGICAGVAAVIFAQRWISGLLPFETGANAPAMAAIVVFLLSMAAAFIPSWRASSVDPAMCLRQD